MTVFRAAWFVAALLTSVPLLGAASDGFPPPVVVVYPLTQTSGSTGEAGSNIAILLATKLGQLGGITVKPYTPGTERPQYLQNAIKENADYYVTGFLTPLGAEVSMISQVVSTHSGSVVYSTTITARTYADAAGQADLLREAILRHAGRGLAALDAPPPPPSSTPAPDIGAKGVNITRALRHREKATPAPSPGPSAAASSPAAGPAPARAVAVAPYRTLVLEVGGDGDAATRTSLATDLSKAFAGRGFASAFLPVGENDVRAHASDICAANAGTRALFASTLVVGHASPNESSIQLDVTAYDCTGATLGRQRVVSSGSGRGGLQGALDRAAQSAADAFAKAGVPAKPAA